jgi:ferredoxin
VAEFKVTLKTPTGAYEIECDSSINILDQAEASGIDIPYACRNGSCSSCAGKLLKGTVDQEDQMFLDDYQIEEGFILTCVTKPTSDCVIKTDVASDV